MSRAGASDRAGAVPGAAAARSGRTAGTQPGARDRSRGFPWGLRRAGAAGSPAGTAACGQPRQGMPLPVRRCSWPMAVPDTTWIYKRTFSLPGPFQKRGASSILLFSILFLILWDSPDPRAQEKAGEVRTVHSWARIQAGACCSVRGQVNADSQNL